MPAAAMARIAVRSIVIVSPFCIPFARWKIDVAPSNKAHRLPDDTVPWHALRPNSDHRCWHPVSTGNWFSFRYFTATREDFLPFHANGRGLHQFLLLDREAREIFGSTRHALDRDTRVAGLWIAGVRATAMP